MAQRPRPKTAELLDLAPHPEGGWYRETWRAAPASVPDGYQGPRAAATGIYFLLTPGEESAWHRVRSDEAWLWHSGGPLTLLDGGNADTPADTPAAAALGPDLAAGQRPQHVIPAGHWQAARPAAAAEVLVSCVVAPGFDFADFTLAPARRRQENPNPSSGTVAADSNPPITLVPPPGRPPPADRPSPPEPPRDGA